MAHTWTGQDGEDAARHASWMNDLEATVVGVVNGGFSPRMVVPRITTPPSLVVTTFQSGHGFTTAGGTANLDDTSTYILGSQGVTLTTTGSGGSGSFIRNLGMGPFDLTGLIPVVTFMVEDWSTFDHMYVTFGDTSLTNTFHAWIKDDLYTAQNQMLFQNGEWGVLTVPWGRVSVAGGSPNRAAVTDFQFQVVDKSGGAGAGCTVHVNGLYFVPEPTLYAKGVVSVTFDDGYASQYTQGRKKLDQYGYGATLFKIVDTPNPTLAQLHELEDAHGWEIGGHANTTTVHNAGLTGVSLDVATADIQANRRWLLGEGFRGADHFAYPGGSYNAAIETVIKENYASARLVNSTYQGETLVPCRAHRLRIYEMFKTTSVATVEGVIDSAYTNKEWLILCFHDLVTPSVGADDVTIADFGTIIDYLATKGIPVKPVGAVLRSLTATT